MPYPAERARARPYDNTRPTTSGYIVAGSAMPEINGFTQPLSYWVGMDMDPRATLAALAEFDDFYSGTHVREGDQERRGKGDYDRQRLR